MPGNWSLKVDFDGHADATDMLTAYPGTANCPGTSLRTEETTGFSGTNASAEQGVAWDSNATADKRRSHPPSLDHYSQVKVVSLAGPHSPGVLMRCDAAANDDYGMRPPLHAWREIFEHLGGVFTSLVFNFSAPTVVGDTLYCECKGTTLNGGRNGFQDITTTDATHVSGDVGIESFRNPTSAIGDDWEAGDNAVLTGLSILEDAEGVAAGFPLEMSAGVFVATYVGHEHDLGTDALRWWSVLVDSHERETELVSSATYGAGSGEANWRHVLGREATEGKPGGNFDLRADSLLKVDDDELRVAGSKGQHGRHTRARVYTRFLDAAQVWGPYLAGEWVGKKQARGIQIKIDVDRISLSYQRRITKIEITHAT